MTNLLPETAKKQVHTEYLFRLGVVTLSLSIFSFIAGAVFLLPSLFLAEIKEREALGQAAVVEKAGLLREGTDLFGAIESVNKKIAVFSGIPENEQKVYELFRGILAARAEGFSITGLLYQKTIAEKKSVRKIIVQGESLRRDGLLAFADALKKKGLFSSINVPTASLIRSADLPFSITLILKE